MSFRVARRSVLLAAATAAIGFSSVPPAGAADVQYYGIMACSPGRVTVYSPLTSIPDTSHWYDVYVTLPVLWQWNGTSVGWKQYNGFYAHKYAVNYDWLRYPGDTLFQNREYFNVPAYNKLYRVLVYIYDTGTGRWQSNWATYYGGGQVCYA